MRGKSASKPGKLSKLGEPPPSADGTGLIKQLIKHGGSAPLSSG